MTVPPSAMASSSEGIDEPPSQWETALRLENKLANMLKDRACTGRALDQIIAALQDNYQNVLFNDFQFACANDIESRMWLRHHKIIERYRKNLAQFQERNAKRRPVELRKLQDAFINFIKQTTRFYRSFIQRLVSHFQVKELEWIVHKFHLAVSPAVPNIEYDSDIKAQVVRSCHRTMVYLGDLSRYREIPRSSKNWGPAIGYYTLAKELAPSSGAPHNQLAVIASNEGSNLSSTYHLYRAVSVLEPFPEAGDNLRLGFRKALKAYKAGKQDAGLVRKEEQVVKDLIPLFLKLHARCFSGKEFVEYESAESEMLTQLALDLKDRNLSDGMLMKLVMINICAQAYSAHRSARPLSPYHPASFHRLNIATFTTLHQVFQPELERATGERSGNDLESISAVGRRMLPSLRLYSTWLRANHQLLVEKPDTAIAVLIKQLWQTYANTLSLLAATFAIEPLPRLNYLLEEDKEMIGFQPFAAVKGWSGHGLHDPPTDHAHPNEEMLARIRFLLEDGIQLCQKDDVPLTMSGSTVTYQEDGILTSTPSIGMNSGLNNTNDSSLYVARGKVSDIYPMADSVLGQAGTSIVGSVASSETMALLNKMVDNLVGPRDQPPSEDGIEY